VLCVVVVEEAAPPKYKNGSADGPASRDLSRRPAFASVIPRAQWRRQRVDYVDALDGGFKVNNPNAATSCSCGESFSA
jgi:hypothetical protein